MRMLHPSPSHDLTYNDVFMVPSLSACRLALRRRPHHARRRRHHDPARRVEHDRRRRAAHGRDGRPPRRRHRAAAGHPARRDRDGGQVRQDAAIRCSRRRSRCRRTHTIGDALGLIHKRAHGAVVVVDDDGHPVGVFTEHDAAGFDRFTQLRNVMSSELVTLAADIDAGEGVRAADPGAGCRWRRSSTPTAACSACSRARARCAPRSTARPSTPTGG